MVYYAWDQFSDYAKDIYGKDGYIVSKITK